MTILFRRLPAFASVLWSSARHRRECLPTVSGTYPRFFATAASNNNNLNMVSMEQLLSFAGTWTGEGHVLNAAGETVATYTEQAEFKPVRKTEGFVVYRHTQETQHAVKQVPMHTETGFLKLSTDGTVVGSFAHPFPSGFVDEMSEGSFQVDDDKSAKILTLTAKDFQRAVQNPNNGKKQVQGFRRVYTLEEGDSKLSYKQYLSTSEGGKDLYHHLTCCFTKN
jgi:THAP4-like, heme-binding beta-barrel domain